MQYVNKFENYKFAKRKWMKRNSIVGFKNFLSR